MGGTKGGKEGGGEEAQIELREEEFGFGGEKKASGFSVCRERARKTRTRTLDSAFPL